MDNWELSMSPDSIRSACGRLGRALFTEDLKTRKSIWGGVIVLFGGLGLLIFKGTQADNALLLPAPGRGLLNHYGFQFCFLSAPFILLTSYMAVACYLCLLSRLDILLDPKTSQKQVTQFITGYLNALFSKNKWGGALGLFIFIGAGFSIITFRQLNNPQVFWGNDVFNAVRYHHGYIWANSVLFITWSFIYPIAFYSAICITISIERIVDHLRKEGLLKLDFLHVDQCGGMAAFGTLNLVIMLIYLGPFTSLYALHVTHKNAYLSLISGSIIMSAVFIVQSIYGVYWISKAIAQERDAMVSVLNKEIEYARGKPDSNPSVILAKLAYRDRVLAVKSFPYSTNISIAVNMLRFMPVAAAVAKNILRHP
jgi:hypothetical protein